MGNNARTQNMTLDYILETLKINGVNIKKDEPSMKAAAENILKAVKNFDVFDPKTQMELASLLAGSPIGLKFDQHESIVAALTGFSYETMKQTREPKGKEPKGKDPKGKDPKGTDTSTHEKGQDGTDAGKPAPKVDETQKPHTKEEAKKILKDVGNVVLHPINTIADISLMNVYATAFVALWDTKDSKPNTIAGEVVKSVALATEVVVGAAALPVITGVVLGAKLTRKIFKGPKDKLAEAIHKKTLERISKTKDALVDEGKKWEKVSQSTIESVDKQFAGLGDIAPDSKSEVSKIHQMLVDSRKKQNPVQEPKGENTPKIPSITECQDAIGEAYGQETIKRDEALLRVMNQDVLIGLKAKTKLPQDVIWTLVTNDAIYFDEEGKMKLEIPSGLDTDIKKNVQQAFGKLKSEDREEVKKLLGRFGERDASLEVMSETDKQNIFNSIKYSDGVINIDEANLSDQAKELVARLNGLKITDREKFEKLSKQIQESHSVIDFLVDCEQEVLARVAIQANEDMQKSVEETKNKQQEQKGVFRSIGRRLVSNDLRRRAANAVENRTQKTINETIIRGGDITSKLIGLAQERLLSKQKEPELTQENERVEDKSTERG